ncbi:MAG: hypothetical protein U5Q16_01675 [Gammaproteobacteria bacterium]|nr:hypothetical protein [Gammaproteobacteria bacterium]
MKFEVVRTALFLGLAGVSAAAGAVLDGDLGRWLDDTAAPQLGETLSRHPRFQGETIRLAAVTPGSAPGRSNALARAVEDRLRQRLLAVEGVRLAADGPRRNCEAPQTIGYLLRLEVSGQGRHNGRVHIAVVDVAESVWVSGISHQWQGRLSAAERAALEAPVNQASPGSAGSPIPLRSADHVASAVKADLACLLPRDINGAVYIETPEDAALARVSLALQAELMYESFAALTPARDDAGWLLTLNTDSADADVRELSLTLSEAGGGNRQKVASVFVSGPLEAPSEETTAAAAPQRRLEPGALPPMAAGTPPAAADLLSALHMTPARPEGICDHRRARVNSCVEVSFELIRPAYLFVLSTREHTLADVSCDAARARAEAGQRRYRMRVAPGDFAVDPRAAGPDAGFYVLAARDRAVAGELQQALAGAPGQCGRPRGGSTAHAQWLSGLRRVLDVHGGQIDWRALHLVHDTDGIVAL